MCFPAAKQYKKDYSHRAFGEILHVLCLVLFSFWLYESLLQSRVEDADHKVQRPEKVREGIFFFTRNPWEVWKLIFPGSSVPSASSLPSLQA